MRKSDIKAIKSSVVFSGLKDDQAAEILNENESNILTYGKGQNIFSPDSYKKCLVIILRGSAEVIKEKENYTVYMNTLYAGDEFGMSCLFEKDTDFPTTVRAKENCRVLMIDKDTLMSLFSLYPQTLTRYISVLSNKIHFLNRKIDALSTPNAKTSIKTYLKATAENCGSKEFTLPVSISKLSEMLSIGRTSVYRAMEELTEEGFMKKDGKVIKIL